MTEKHGDVPMHVVHCWSEDTMASHQHLLAVTLKSFFFLRISNKIQLKSAGQ